MDYTVTALGGSSGGVRLIATRKHELRPLVDLALRDPGYTGVEARTHFNAKFYIDSKPLLDGDSLTRRVWMEAGYFAKFGGVLFIDETTPEGQDWAWIAHHQDQIEGVPVVYYDEDTETQFPPRMVMTVDMVHDVVLEWLETGERPATVDWVPVNGFRWKLDGLGDIADSPDMV